MPELIELRENIRFLDNETGPLLRSFFPRCRLSVYCGDRHLGRETREEKQERENGTPIAVLTIEYGETEAALTFSYAGQAAEATCPREKNAVKRAEYELISSLTKQRLPWGSATGIRPTKEALQLREAGKGDREIWEFYREKYLASDAKIRESIEIADAERQVLSRFPLSRDGLVQKDWSLQTDGYSLYIGIAFCPSICLYCSFSSHRIDSCRDMVGDYLDSVKREIDFVAERFKNRRLDTIYIGGGTPTTLSAAQLDGLFSHIEKRLDLSHLAEYTVEAGRPDSITREKLKVCLDHRVGRISVNPQSMNQKTLDLIGRGHTVKETEEAYALARELGFSCINMDMILGLPGEGEEDIRHTLAELKRLSPDDLTIHSLALKTAARLAIEWEKYAGQGFTNSLAVMEEAVESGRAMGMHPYYLYRQKNISAALENVGMARPGKEGIYNVMIMEEREDIVAIGAGAASKKVRIGTEGKPEISRCENVKDIRTYIERTDEMIERKNQLFLDL